MKKIIFGGLLAVLSLSAEGQKTFVGVITDSMCGGNHKMMSITPDEKCVRECVRIDPKKWKYALKDGEKTYVLSDQQTPEKFAAKKVKITGVLYQKTNILKVDKIEAAQ